MGGRHGAGTSGAGTTHGDPGAVSPSATSVSMAVAASAGLAAAVGVAGGPWAVMTVMGLSLLMTWTTALYHSRNKPSHTNPEPGRPVRRGLLLGFTSEADRAEFLRGKGRLLADLDDVTVKEYNGPVSERTPSPPDAPRGVSKAQANERAAQLALRLTEQRKQQRQQQRQQSPAGTPAVTIASAEQQQQQPTTTTPATSQVVLPLTLRMEHGGADQPIYTTDAAIASDCFRLAEDGSLVPMVQLTPIGENIFLVTSLPLTDDASASSAASVVELAETNDTPRSGQPKRTLEEEPPTGGVAESKTDASSSWPRRQRQRSGAGEEYRETRLHLICQGSRVVQSMEEPTVMAVLSNTTSYRAQLQSRGQQAALAKLEERGVLVGRDAWCVINVWWGRSGVYSCASDVDVDKRFIPMYI